VDLYVPQPAGKWSEETMLVIATPQLDAEGLDRWHVGRLVEQIDDSDMNVDDGFGRQARDRGRTDMLNALRLGSQRR